MTRKERIREKRREKRRKKRRKVAEQQKQEQKSHVRVGRLDPRKCQKVMGGIIEPIVANEWASQMGVTFSYICSSFEELIEKRALQIAKTLVFYRMGLLCEHDFLLLFVRNQLMPEEWKKYRISRPRSTQLFTQTDPFGGFQRDRPPYLLAVDELVQMDDSTSLC